MFLCIFMYCMYQYVLCVLIYSTKSDIGATDIGASIDWYHS